MKRRIHYVLSTHWDREWHQTFQDFRYRLVQLFDRVIAGWESGELKGPFQTDGQAIVLEDYLEVRPERRSLVEKLAQDGKFVIGPWYGMPDEFTVSGESLIRNLRLGREIARCFGTQPSNAGFVCDIFGHNSQMPQIFAGFSIQGAFLWRGTNLLDSRNFIWVGADGTEITCYRFGPIAYCDFAGRVRIAHDVPDVALNPDAFSQRLESFIREEESATVVDPLLMFDGGDHQGWDREVYAVLDGRMQNPDDLYEIVHTSLDAYLEEMLPQKDRITTRISGELREPGWGKLDPEKDPLDMDQQWLIPGVLSSRINLKQANAVCQTLLCQWAEPTSAFASLVLGKEYPQGLLNLSWRYLLQNHPHDSIDGCSIDQVHKDMEYRFDQSRQISHRVQVEATRHLGASVEGSVNDHEFRVDLFNPLPRTFERVVEIPLKIPPEWTQFNEFFGFEPKPAFRIFDATGNEVPYQRLRQEKGKVEFRLRDTRFPENVTYDVVRVAVSLKLPAMGYTTLLVVSGHEGEFTRYPQKPGMVTSERSMENEFLKVEFEPNGTLTLTDKKNEQVYQRLLTFEDTADIGDGWYHGMAVNDQKFYSTGCPASIACLHDGALVASFLVRVTMEVPEEFVFSEMKRSSNLKKMVLENQVTLYQDSDQVEVETRLTNNVGDHRLRVLFPSGAQTDSYLADSAFDVVERPIALRDDNHLYRELEVETKPQQSWTAIFDENRGLAVIADGLLETAIRDLPERPLALTLFRATRRTVGTNGEPGGQLFRPLSFRYAIRPVQKELDLSRLCETGQQVAAGLQIVQLANADIHRYRCETSLPGTGSFLEIDGAVVVTSVRMVGEGLEVRMFNPSLQSVRAKMTVLKDFWKVNGPAHIFHHGSIFPVDLESNPLELKKPFNGSAEIDLRPKQIVTIRIER